jgi:hypothetical protein
MMPGVGFMSMLLVGEPHVADASHDDDRVSVPLLWEVEVAMVRGAVGELSVAVLVTRIVEVLVRVIGPDGWAVTGSPSSVDDMVSAATRSRTADGRSTKENEISFFKFVSTTTSRSAYSDSLFSAR